MEAAGFEACLEGIRNVSALGSNPNAQALSVAIISATRRQTLAIAPYEVHRYLYGHLGEKVGVMRSWRYSIKL